MRPLLPVVAFALLAVSRAAPMPVASDVALDQQFTTKVQPFLQTYCLGCHGTEKQESDLDLSPYTSVSRVIAGFSYWDLVLEKLEAAEMPPDKAKKHPTDAQRDEIVAWIHALRKNESAKTAGDPGPVLARRLSNAEYDYTIRDLTGVDIRPTKEFPVDPANQAGFDNSGESLAMSPALVKKYLQAARTVADHLVLQPAGLAFAPHPVVADTDRDKYSVLRIVDFYKRQPTDYADYFAAAWRYQHRAALGRARASLADFAGDARLSAKYLGTVWSTLTTKEDVGPVAHLQTLWRELPAPRPGQRATGSVTADVESDVRARCRQMRDYVLQLREKIVPEVKNLMADKTGIQNGSQTLVMWKNRQMAANRRRFDPSALHVEGAEIAAEPPPAAMAEPSAVAAPAPATSPNINAVVNDVTAAAKAPSLAQSAAAEKGTPNVVKLGGNFLAPAITTTGTSATFKMAASKHRGSDPDLLVPADPAARAKYEAAFARFASVFPDAFYITERARVYLDAEKEQKLAGRLLSAGIHSQTGYFRDDGPLYDLVLDDAGRRELDALWQEFDFCAAIPIRMHTSFVWFERTDSSFMRDAEFDPYRPEDKSVSTQAKIQKLAELYLAKAQRNGASEAVQEAIRDHFAHVAASNLWLDQTRVAAVPKHLQALEDFAARAWRRPLTARERENLRDFYRASREQNGVEHEDAMRDAIVAVLMSPNFNYRIDLTDSGKSTAGQTTAAGKAQFATLATATDAAGTPARTGIGALSDYALASRLSYFLWSSMPDAELLAHAAAGDLHQPAVLAAQARRMVKDPRVRRLATEFGGNWLDFRRFEEHNAVDRERFPTFDNELRSAMFEEPLRFFVDVAQGDRSILNFIYGDYTFVNAPLAKHYGMPYDRLAGARRYDETGDGQRRSTSGANESAPRQNGNTGPSGSDERPRVDAADGWIRVDHASRYERGGLLPMSVFLTANSPGLRTSPVKRGYWVVRRVLGERIPPPPAVVPSLPNDEKSLGNLTLRETLVQHRADKSCAACHARFDSFGLVFEGFGPVGERREKDFAGHVVDTRAPFPGGTEAAGLTGLRDYIRAHRQNDFVDNLCRKFVAYALGRTLLMSDDHLIQEMKTKLAANDYRFGVLVESVVTSPQFRTKRLPVAANTATTKTASLP
jgi:hypothetical protein